MYGEEREIYELKDGGTCFLSKRPGFMSPWELQKWDKQERKLIKGS